MLTFNAFYKFAERLLHMRVLLKRPILNGNKTLCITFNLNSTVFSLHAIVSAAVIHHVRMRFELAIEIQLHFVFLNGHLRR
jgi:hypothetical protein